MNDIKHHSASEGKVAKHSKLLKKTRLSWTPCTWKGFVMMLALAVCSIGPQVFQTKNGLKNELLELCILWTNRYTLETTHKWYTLETTQNRYTLETTHKWYTLETTQNRYSLETTRNRYTLETQHELLKTTHNNPFCRNMHRMFPDSTLLLVVKLPYYLVFPSRPSVGWSVDLSVVIS